MRIEAKNLQDALLVAAAELECSVLDLEYEVVQHHKNGILGLFQKNSIIEARCKRRKGDKKFGKKRDFEGRYSNSRYNERYEDGRDFEGRNQRENSRFEGRFDGSNERGNKFESGSSERGNKFESTSSNERGGKFSKGYDSFTDKAFYDDFSSEDKKSKSFENTYSKPFESKKPHQSEASSESVPKKSEPKPYSISTNQPKSKANSSQNSSGVASNLSQNDTRNSNVSSNLTQNQVAENVNSSPNSAVEGLNSAQELNLTQNSNQNSAQSSATQAPKPSVSTIQKSKYVVRDDDIFNSFHKESVPNPKLYIDEIRIQLDKLLKAGEFGVRISELSVYDKDSIYIKLEGEDAALLIGKEAYRYKALSYLLHNWINSRYKLLIRLEIADFLRNQSQSMDFYLQSIIERVEATGKAQTKPLDGVLVKLALEKLRERFPNKYVGIKQNGEEKIVIINDFLKKNE